MWSPAITLVAAYAVSGWEGSILKALVTGTCLAFARFSFGRYLNMHYKRIIEQHQSRTTKDIEDEVSSPSLQQPPSSPSEFTQIAPNPPPLIRASPPAAKKILTSVVDDGTLFSSVPRYNVTSRVKRSSETSKDIEMDTSRGRIEVGRTRWSFKVGILEDGEEEQSLKESQKEDQGGSSSKQKHVDKSSSTVQDFQPSNSSSKKLLDTSIAESKESSTDQRHNLRGVLAMNVYNLISTFYFVVGAIMFRQRSEDQSLFYLTATLSVVGDFGYRLFSAHLAFRSMNLKEENEEKILKAACYITAMVAEQTYLLLSAMFVYIFTSPRSPFLTFTPQCLARVDISLAKISTQAAFFLFLTSLRLVTFIILLQTHWKVPVAKAGAMVKLAWPSYGMACGFLVTYSAGVMLVVRGIFPEYLHERLLVCELDLRSVYG
ncbi:hypothetical protein HDV05_007264 [Chytridiales sp. JEL 0842]|nr:hypothetical protein HDV05_007264 [Chytridiales sp. JEL 0842]